MSLSCKDSRAFLDNLQRDQAHRTATAAATNAGIKRKRIRRTTTTSKDRDSDELENSLTPPMMRKAQSNASGLPPKPSVFATAAAPVVAFGIIAGSTSSLSTKSCHQRSLGLTDGTGMANS
ncbi:hypothetical protein MHU86_845 [Fragilaria crotonensis]|nr:hypothetical protein MHU86_845 [Fragilaria crotonensis]